MNQHHHPPNQGAEAPPMDGGTSVLVNVGGDAGALVLYADVSRNGLEVYLESISDPMFRTHVWVLPRPGGKEVVYAAVFPSLTEGDYVVLEPDGSPGRRVKVTGGEVAESRWTPPGED